MDYTLRLLRIMFAVLFAALLFCRRIECKNSSWNKRIGAPVSNHFQDPPWKRDDRKFLNQQNSFNVRNYTNLTNESVRKRNSIVNDFRMPVLSGSVHLKKYKTFTKDTRRAAKSYLTNSKPLVPFSASRLDSNSNKTLEGNSSIANENAFIVDVDLLSVQNSARTIPYSPDNSSEILDANDFTIRSTTSIGPKTTLNSTTSIASSTGNKPSATTLSSDLTALKAPEDTKYNVINNSSDNVTITQTSISSDSVDYRIVIKNSTNESDVSIVTLDTHFTGITNNLTTITSVSNLTLSIDVMITDNDTNSTNNWIHEAKIVWGIAWELHIYPLAALFILLAVTCCITVVNNLIGRQASFYDRTTFLMVYGLFFVSGSSRSFLLLYDPYNTNKYLSPLLEQLIYDLTYPCIMSAFAITFIILMKIINFYCKVLFFMQTRRLTVIIVLHFLTVVASDVIFDYSDVSLVPIFLVTQGLCFVWVLFLLLSFFKIYQQLYLAAVRKQGEVIRATFTKLHIEGAPLPSKFPRPFLAHAVRFLIVFAVFGILLTTFNIFGVVLTTGIISRRHLLYWPWWIYHFSNRLLELFLSILLLIIVNHLYYYQESCISNRNTHSSLFSRFVQRIIRYCTSRSDAAIGGDDIYPTYHVSNAAVARTHFTFERWDASLPVTFCNPDVSTPSLHPTTSRNVATMFSSAPSKDTNISSLSSRYMLSSSLSNASECYRSLGSKRQAMRATMPPLSDVHSRPPSMLFNENGFIRFRDAGDPEQPMVMTDEEGLPDGEKITIGCEGGKLECHVDSIRRMIRGSHETDVSSADQWSTCGNNRFGIGTLRRYGSTCSSESASTSFDVHLFLHPPPLSGTKTMKLCNRRSVNTTPSKEVTNVGVGNRVSTASGTFTRPPAPPHLNLTPNSRKTPVLPEAQNIQDITPDSAVFLELPTPSDKEKSVSGGILISNFPRAQNQQDLTFSQSLNDLQCETPSILTPKHRGRSRSLLSRLKGSTFSLASHHGYEPLDSRVSPQTTIGRTNKLWRTNSEDPSVLNAGHPRDFRQWEMRTVFRDSGASSRMSRGERRRDSFYDSDLSSTTGSRDMIYYVDMEVQTDPVDFSQTVQPKMITEQNLKIPEDSGMKTPSPILVMAEQESTL